MTETPVCQFARITPQKIRCPHCGTERDHEGNPLTYLRLCTATGVATFASAAARTSLPLITPCVHRGQVVEKGTCNVCGMKGQPFEIHTCALHDRCMDRRFRNDRPAIKVCMQCGDYEANGRTT